MNTRHDQDHSTIDTVLHVLVAGGVAALLGLAIFIPAALPLVV